MQTYNSRKDVPDKYKWDLTEIFKDDNEFKKAVEDLKIKIDELKKYKGHIKDSKMLLEFMDKNVDAISLWEDIYVYAYLINDQELGNSNSIINKGIAEKLNMDLEANTSYFAPELLELNEDDYNKLFESNKELLKYKFELDSIYRTKKHILTSNEEKIVSSLVLSMNHFDDISSNLINNEHYYGKVKDNDGNVFEIATNNYRKLMHNKDVNFRKKVYKLFNRRLEEYSGTNANLLNSYVSMNNEIAKIRHYKDSWDSRLFELNLSDKVFKTLVNTTENNLDVLHKYYDIKKKALGLDKLHTYDLNLDMSCNDREYSIEDAQSILREALKPLGNDYMNHFNKIFDNKYIDYCQYKGKCSGAYSFSTINHDSRILMSFNNELDSISTIAHEGGHNVHHQYVKANNDPVYRSPSSIVCEVASLTNECLLSDYIYKNGKTINEKKAGLNNIIGVIISNLFGAVREGKLEQDMYKEVFKGNSITRDFMDKKTKNALKRYYGKSVVTDKYIKNGWVTRSHYYMHFYLYSYAICISVASYVASKILAGDKDMLDKYIKFLKTGSDKWPHEAFSVLGINLEDEKVYLDAIKYFDSLLDKFNLLLDKEVV
ncbi:MAG: oligoendopeptidase F family protein [Bacilli bacterium]|nr:oligoendopeptidase F family protein [Bacilli bacterium]